MEPKEVTLTDGATPRRVVAKSRGSANHYNDGSDWNWQGKKRNFYSSLYVGTVSRKW